MYWQIHTSKDIISKQVWKELIDKLYCSQVWSLAQIVLRVALDNWLIHCDAFMTGHACHYGRLVSKARKLPCIGLTLVMQGSFWVWAQPMRGDVTLWGCLSLVESICRMIPAMLNLIKKHKTTFVFSTISKCEIVQVVEILPLRRQWPIYPA